MTITSLSFIIFIVPAVAVYYLTPKRYMWITLLFLSFVFYFLAAVPYTLVFLLITALTAQISSYFMEKTEKYRNAVAFAAIAVNILLWFLFKGSTYWIGLSAALHSVFPAVPVLSKIPLPAAFGMSYYTFQSVSYIIDCLWKTSKREKNFFRLLLFLMFFPQLTTGPFSRYNALQSVYEGRNFDIDRIYRGAQRILWGFFKKLVLAERIGAIVDTVYGAPDAHIGLWYVLSFLLYPLQLYADFSGSVDIVLGVAELFGIELPENFNNPLFAETSQEFWQRWHMSLGSWVKDYIMYPVLKSKPVLEAGNRIKAKHGKKASKLVTLGIGMFCTWMFIGIWHGGYRYILGCGIYYWAVMLSYEILSPYLSRINKALGINGASFSYHLMRKLRTYLILCISMVFFRSDGIMNAFRMLKAIILSFTPDFFNPWIFVNGALADTGLSGTDTVVIIISLLLMLLAALMREKKGHARDWIAEQGIVFRWSAWLVLFTLVMIFGMYGPGYQAADFIYQGF